MDNKIDSLTARIDNKIDALAVRMDNLELRILKLEESKKNSSTGIFSIQNWNSSGTSKKDCVNIGQITFSSNNSKNNNISGIPERENLEIKIKDNRKETDCKKIIQDKKN